MLLTFQVSSFLFFFSLLLLKSEFDKKDYTKVSVDGSEAFLFTGPILTSISRWKWTKFSETVRYSLPDFVVIFQMLFLNFWKKENLISIICEFFTDERKFAYYWEYSFEYSFRPECSNLFW